MKASQNPMGNGLHDLTIELAPRLIGPDDEDLLNDDDDFVTYARPLHPAELKVLEARHHLRLAERWQRSEPLLTFHLSAAFTAMVACGDILRYHKGGKEYSKWWSQTRKMLNEDDGWQTLKAWRNKLVHQGLERFTVHLRLSYVEEEGNPRVESDVGYIEIDGRRIDSPFEMSHGVISLLGSAIEDAKSNGHLEPPEVEGRTLQLEFVKIDADGSRQSVSPTDLETTQFLKQFGWRQSVNYDPKES